MGDLYLLQEDGARMRWFFFAHFHWRAFSAAFKAAWKAFWFELEEWYLCP